MNWGFLFTTILFLSSAFVVAEDTLLDGNKFETDCLKIRNIIIKANDVFEDDDDPNFFESTLNFFHFTTRDSVIQKELLFQEGECLNQELVDETARNLRAFTIFSDARLTIVPTEESKSVDVIVMTKDRFTLRAEVGASHKSGTTKTRLSFGEKNIFGQNKSLHVSHTDEDGETLTRYVYSDNRFFHDYEFNALYISARDGGLESYSLNDPFRSLDDKSSYGISYQKNTQNFVVKLDDNEEVEIPQFHESESVFYAYELGDRKNSERLGFNLSRSQQDYFSEQVNNQADIPDRLEKVDFDVVSFLTDRHDFIVMQGLDSLTYLEDIELMNSLFFGIGLQWREDLKGSVYHPKYQIGYSHSKWNQKDVLSSTYFHHQGRFYAGQLLESETTAFYHCYYLPKPGHIWLGGITYQYRYGRDILNDSLSMGGDEGLRGYETNSFTGNKSLLFNFEFRHRLPSKWSKIALGQAFFVDSGYAWKKGEDIAFEDLKVNVGWGLRLDMPSIFGDKLLRFDLAVATETGEVLASIVVGQIFKYNELSETNKDF
jgi:outer membrane protein assembly factor BamA